MIGATRNTKTAKLIIIILHRRMIYMQKEKEESIYQYINRMAVEHPGLPYAFQDAYFAGLRDVLHVLWEDELPIADKEKLAMEVMDKVVACIEDQACCAELQRMLEEATIMLYLVRLTGRIRLLLSEKFLDKDKLYSLGMKLATESGIDEEVKLGILILGFFENDLTRQIIKTLGLHSILTIYAAEASKNFSDHNEFLFEIAENTCGYGKLAALSFFEPVLPKQK